jgi:hypothetical protein
MKRSAAFILTLVAASSFARAASAEPDRPATEAAAAQALFDEGRYLLDEGKIDEACEKLARSHRLDPAGGTLLNLALCHEKQGRLATAWTEYSEGLALARRDRHDVRMAFAEEHLAALTKRLPRARFVIRGRGAEEVTVRLDGVVLDRAALGVAIPLDPGGHKVHASAAGHVAWTKDVSVKAGETTEVEIPELTPAPPKPEEPPPPTVKKGRRVAGWITVGVGAAAIVSGTAFGIIALTKNSKAEEICPSDPCTDSEAAHLSEDANTLAWVSNAAIGAGIVAVVVGTVLVLTSSAPAVKATPTANGFAIAF